MSVHTTITGIRARVHAWRDRTLVSRTQGYAKQNEAEGLGRGGRIQGSGTEQERLEERVALLS